MEIYSFHKPFPSTNHFPSQTISLHKGFWKVLSTILFSMHGGTV